MNTSKIKQECKLIEQHRDIITGQIMPDRIIERPCMWKMSPMFSALDSDVP